MAGKTGVQMIADERMRQITVEGWDLGHDLEHEPDAMAIAGACYAVNGAFGGKIKVTRYSRIERDVDAFPFRKEWDKRAKHDRLRSLVIAGALIAAEIDRMNNG
jgi:hypothetical protein